MPTFLSTKDLGELVRQERLRQGLKQADLAALTGCGPRFIGELERGKATLQWGKVLDVFRGLGIVIHPERPETEHAEPRQRKVSDS